MTRVASPAGDSGFKPDNHPGNDGRPLHGRIGVLLMNLGTPEGTDYWSMRRYLKEFLSDRRVIETSRLLWWPLLNLIILTKRPAAKGRDYASIWNTERNESPLKTITRAQAEQLAAAMAGIDGRIVVDWAMRYGLPSVEDRVKALQDQGCDRILMVPLYPQYAAATTATAMDQAFRALMKMRWQPTIRVAPPYYNDPAHIDAVTRSLKGHLAKLDFEPEVILVSFHGMPKDYLLKGDPYYCQCHVTWRLMREAMGWPEERFRMSFQSLFGKGEWLRPYTDETIRAMARDGVKRLAVVTPGFAADCLETLEEIGVENAEYFHENGGEQYAAIPCLNDSPENGEMLRTLVMRELQGWI